MSTATATRKQGLKDRVSKVKAAHLRQPTPRPQEVTDAIDDLETFCNEGADDDEGGGF